MWDGECMGRRCILPRLPPSTPKLTKQKKQKNTKKIQKLIQAQSLSRKKLHLTEFEAAKLHRFTVDIHLVEPRG